MSRSSVSRLALAVVLACLAVAPACAAETGAVSLFVQGGVGEQSVHVASLGAAWGLPWHNLTGGITTRLEVFASDWSTPSVDGGRRSLVQVGVVPTVRLRPGQGRSPWFVDVGIGVSLLDRELVMPERRFSTRLNFSDNLALGRSFGARETEEVSLHVQHTSNAGIRTPNPGLDLVMLRYAHNF